MQQFLKILTEKNNQQRKIDQEDKSLIITKLKQKNLHTYNRRERKEFTFLSREETDLNSKARLKKKNPFRAIEREIVRDVRSHRLDSQFCERNGKYVYVRVTLKQV